MSDSPRTLKFTKTWLEFECEEDTLAFDFLWRTRTMHFLSRSQALSIVMEEERVRVRIYAWPFFSRVWIDKLGDTTAPHTVVKSG